MIDEPEDVHAGDDHAPADEALGVDKHDEHTANTDSVKQDAVAPVVDGEEERHAREERVADVAGQCNDLIDGLRDDAGHHDLRAINQVMLRLRGAFGG